MDICYSTSQRGIKRYTTRELRDKSLIQNLYVASEIVVVYSYVDHMVTLGYMPTIETVSIDKGINYWKNFGTHYFLERREIDTSSIGDSGRIVADGQEFQMRYKDCLYIAKGTKEVYFSSGGVFVPAKFYIASAPAHTSYTITYIPIAKATKRPYGASGTASKRVINQSIHPDIPKICQLSMGMTVLEEGNVQNTTSAHTHEHRMEVYMHFEVPGDNVVFCMMGGPTETRHIVIKNEGTVISPSWSIHNGAGTSNHTFIWAMGEENMEFDDMDTMISNQVK